MSSLPTLLSPQLAKAAISLACLLVLLGLAPVPAAAVNLEAAALLTVRKGFTNGAAVLPDWTNASVLDVSGNKLVGTLPLDFRFPASLEHLYLWNNTFTGTIPVWELPENVTELDISVNHLLGPYPQGWVLPQGLRMLNLDVNRLSGTLDPTWGVPPTLQRLALNENRFRGTIPSNWTLPDSLQQLYLNDNPLLSGTIPQDWVLPTALVELALSNCSFSGPLPTHLKLPTGLQGLGLADNIFTGTIPADWELPDSLQTLDLSSNSLTGTIPANLTLPSSLLVLSLSDNQLTGSFSEKWKLPSTLQVLSLDNNRLTGTLDPAWGFPLDLQNLTLGANQFRGTIPSSWTLPDSLQQLYLNDNPLLTGTIPQDWVLPAALVELGLFNCSFSGPLSMHLKLPSGLQGLYLHDNQLSGTLDPAWELPDSLEVILLINNNLTGLLPAWNLPNLTVAALWGCNFTGLGDDLESSTGQRRSPGQGGFEAKVAADELSSRATESASSGSQAFTASTATEAAQRDPVLAVALKTEVSNDNAGESAASQQRMSRQSLEMSALRMWTINFKALELQRQIGEGSFGRVYVARWQQTPVAVKILLNTALDVYSEDAVKQALTLSNPVLENLQKEAALMCSLRHPSIVTFLGVCTVPPCIVTEYCERGSLADVLRNARQSPAAAAKLDWLRRLSMMLDTAKGMLHLHSHSPPIIHRDLKSPNLLVDTHWRCKISDFNLSRILEDRVVLSSAMATNPRWLAPEVLEGQPATLQSDVYSFGIVLWEVMTLDVPFANDNHFQLIKHVRAGGRPPVPPQHELPGREGGEAGGLDDYVALMQRCWAQAPEERPSFQDVVSKFK
ncbi:hypothetical protein N2152v2_009621 [Parachlorella kessleri]